MLYKKYYSRLPIDNSNQQGKSKKVRVIGSLRQIAGSKEISKWMGIAKYAGMDTEFELE